MNDYILSIIPESTKCFSVKGDLLEHYQLYQILSLVAKKSGQKDFPKLTADVFNRPDCPEWAKYAAVDADGRGYFYEYKPYLKEQIKRWDVKVGEVKQIKNVFFSNSKYYSSLIILEDDSFKNKIIKIVKEYFEEK
jgi:hypothetical protein